MNIRMSRDVDIYTHVHPFMLLDLVRYADARGPQNGFVHYGPATEQCEQDNAIFTSVAYPQRNSRSATVYSPMNY